WGIQPGVRAVARRLKAADGRIGLLIDPRCAGLIRSLTAYRYPADQPEAELPVKDGHDHAADALRYLVAALEGEAMLAGRGRGY
ncbi:MAG: hypothetical protein V2J24_04950, partial [Pseudomonadales bacterium]|nr:hypothetical protein [Pseudomonadales bacterium]